MSHRCTRSLAMSMSMSMSMFMFMSMFVALASAGCPTAAKDTGSADPASDDSPESSTPGDTPLGTIAGTGASTGTPAGQPPITHGVAIGEVSHQGCVFWSRTDREARMHAVLEHPRHGIVAHTVSVSQDDDFTGVIEVRGLAPDTEYRYALWFAEPDVARAAKAPEHAWRGKVRTAPIATEKKALRFAWGGDLAGQDMCRDSARGFAIMDHLRAEELDFFIALGDMIYADNPCTARGKYGNAQIPGLDIATEIHGFWAHWKYARDDHGFRDLLARVPIFPVWDDHEVVNDVGPAHDTRSTAPYAADQPLLPIGLRAFLDYNPLPRATVDTRRLYRRVRWGKHLELFFLDTRQYRDSNRAPDTGDTPKSMLGAGQRAWLERGLSSSDATWKIVVSSVPMSIPTGYPPENGRDGWANHDQETGFERELLGILRTLERAGVDRTIWLSTDVHFAAGFRYTPFADRPGFQVHEWISGPLNAGLFPQDDYDRTLGPERLLIYGPKNAESLTYQEALGWMNYGRVDIDESGELTVSIVNGRGETVHQHTLDPASAPQE